MVVIYGRDLFYDLTNWRRVKLAERNPIPPPLSGLTTPWPASPPPTSCSTVASSICLLKQQCERGGCSGSPPLLICLAQALGGQWTLAVLPSTHSAATSVGGRQWQLLLSLPLSVHQPVWQSHMEWRKALPVYWFAEERWQWKGCSRW